MINCIKWRKPSKESLESALLHSATRKSGSGLLVKSWQAPRGGGKAWFILFANFCGVKTPAMSNFEWPRWCHWMWIWKEKHPISSWELVWACSSDSTGDLGKSTSSLGKSTSGGTGGSWGADALWRWRQWGFLLLEAQLLRRGESQRKVAVSGTYVLETRIPLWVGDGQRMRRQRRWGYWWEIGDSQELWSLVI